MKIRFARGAAFSLVEVTIALGVIAFAVVSIIGLLAVSFNTSRASASDSAMGSMIGTVMNRFRSQPFDSIAGGDFYFDADGALQASQGPYSAYKCTVTVIDDPDTAGTGATGGAQINLKRVNLEFTWPAAALNPPNRRMVNAAVARH